MKITFSNSAFADLESIIHYYSTESIPEVGKRLVSEIFEHIEVLLEHPEIGRVVPEFDENHIREIIHPPFRIVYLREETKVQIIRVWRSERLLNLPDDKI